MKKEHNVLLMFRMSKLVKPLAGYMALAVLLGVLGFLCAIFIPFFASITIAHVAQGFAFPVSLFFCYDPGHGNYARDSALWRTGMQSLYRL